MSWSGPLWIERIKDPLCFLDLDVCFLSKIREVFSYYIFKYVLYTFFSSSGVSTGSFEGELDSEVVVGQGSSGSWI